MLQTASTWSMPVPPAPGLIPGAQLIGPSDGWELYWLEGDEGDGEYWEVTPGSGPAHIDWPFGPDDIATYDDMRSAGFTIID